MSSGQKAVYEAEEDWHDLKILAKIPSVNWKVYSISADYAKEGFNKFKLTGEFLIHYVELRIKIDSLITEQRNAELEYAKFLELKAKYG